MKLYKVVFRPYSQKDNEEGIKEFIIADNDDDMFNYVDIEHTYGSWSDIEWGWEFVSELTEEQEAILITIGIAKKYHPK